MSLRKASAYSHMRTVPFTRTSKKKNKAYIKVIPPHKIAKFTMGRSDLLNQKKLPFIMEVVAAEECQIRNNALEAVRMYLTKFLDEALPGQYYFRVIPYPHHIQRENKMLTGAGADRMQTGMSRSFGRSIAKAAILKKGGIIFFFALPNDKALANVRNHFKIVKPKLPCKVHINERKLE